MKRCNSQQLGHLMLQDGKVLEAVDMDNYRQLVKELSVVAPARPRLLSASYEEKKQALKKVRQIHRMSGPQRARAAFDAVYTFDERMLPRAEVIIKGWSIGGCRADRVLIHGGGAYTFVATRDVPPSTAEVPGIARDLRSVANHTTHSGPLRSVRLVLATYLDPETEVACRRNGIEYVMIAGDAAWVMAWSKASHDLKVGLVMPGQCPAGIAGGR